MLKHFAPVCVPGHCSWLCLLTICLLTNGCGKVHDPNARAVTEYVLKAGGTVIPLHSELPIKNSADIPQEDFAIREINLTDWKADTINKDIGIIEDLPYLESLNLHGTKLNDAGLESIINLPKLQKLEIAYTQVTDAAVSKLTRFPRLNKIFLYGTAVKPQTIEDLMSNLRGVTIYK